MTNMSWPREVIDRDALVEQLRDLLRTERAQFEELSRALRASDDVVDQQAAEIKALQARVKELEDQEWW